MELPEAWRRSMPGGSGYKGVWIRRIRTPRRTYWYFTVGGERRGQYRYYPYTADGLKAAIHDVDQREYSDHRRHRHTGDRHSAPGAR